jgi:hypothetical protein
LRWQPQAEHRSASSEPSSPAGMNSPHPSVALPPMAAAWFFRHSRYRTHPPPDDDTGTTASACRFLVASSASGRDTCRPLAPPWLWCCSCWCSCAWCRPRYGAPPACIGIGNSLCVPEKSILDALPCSLPSSPKVKIFLHGHRKINQLKQAISVQRGPVSE